MLVCPDEPAPPAGELKLSDYAAWRIEGFEAGDVCRRRLRAIAEYQGLHEGGPR